MAKMRRFSPKCIKNNTTKRKYCVKKMTIKIFCEKNAGFLFLEVRFAEKCIINDTINCRESYNGADFTCENEKFLPII